MDWKGIAEKVVVAVLAGAILAFLGWLYTIATAPPPSPVIVSARWMDVPNPAYRLGRPQTLELDAAIAKSFGVHDAATFLSKMGYRPRGRLVVLDIYNVENYRSKAIEITAKEAAVFSTNVSRSDTFQNHLQIESIDPGKHQLIYIVMPPWLYFEKPPIDVLHDGKRVEILTTSLPYDEDSREPVPTDVAVAFILTYPITLGILLVIGLMACVIFAISLLGQLLFSGRLRDVQARYANKEQLKKQIDFIDYVRTHYPKNMPDAPKD